MFFDWSISGSKEYLEANLTGFTFNGEGWYHNPQFPNYLLLLRSTSLPPEEQNYFTVYVCSVDPRPFIARIKDLPSY